MVTQYLRPALLIIAAGIAATAAQSLWNVDRTRAVLLAVCSAVCVAVALLRLKMVRR
jgi:uncharacterized membrane protein YadS